MLSKKCINCGAVLFRSFDHLGFTSVMMDVLVYSLMVRIVVAQKLVLFYVYYDTDFLKQMEQLVRPKY